MYFSMRVEARLDLATDSHMLLVHVRILTRHRPRSRLRRDFWLAVYVLLREVTVTEHEAADASRRTLQTQLVLP